MKRKDILLLFTFTFIVVFIWISSNLYHAYVTSTVSEDLQKQITPISPEFDVATIQQLKTRQKVDPLYIIDTPISVTPTQSATLQLTPTAVPTTSTGSVPTQTTGIVRQGEP